MQRKIERTVLLFFLFALVTVGPVHAQGSRPRIRIAVATATPHNTPLWVARDKKIFEKHGLDVQLIFVSGGTLVTQMLAAGEIEVAAAAPASLLLGSTISSARDSSIRSTAANSERSRPWPSRRLASYKSCRSTYSKMPPWR